jgi:putative transposase
MLHFIVPNHFHVILFFREIPAIGTFLNTPPNNTHRKTPFASPSKTVGAVIRGIKSTTTKQINILRNSPGIPIWQRNYYEHIIRDEKSLFFIRRYIRENPIVNKRTFPKALKRC